jgi:hypothetical protein
VAVALGVAVWFVLTLVPVLHSTPESFAISSLGGPDCGAGPNITSQHNAALAFSWVTNNTGVGDLYLLGGEGPGPAYNGGGTSGVYTASILAGQTYYFWFCSVGPESVVISGTLGYYAPLL